MARKKTEKVREVDDIFELKEFAGSKEVINFATLILFHLDRIGKLGSTDILNSQENRNQWIYAIDTLECFLSPYLDGEYQREREETLSKIDKGKVDAYTRVRATKEKLVALIKVMQRYGLLPARGVMETI